MFSGAFISVIAVTLLGSAAIALLSVTLPRKCIFSCPNKHLSETPVDLIRVSGASSLTSCSSLSRQKSTHQTFGPLY